MVKIKSNSKSKIGYSIELRFIITQHIRDEQLMNSLVLYFGCGKVYPKLDKQSKQKVGLEYTV